MATELELLNASIKFHQENIDFYSSEVKRLTKEVINENPSIIEQCMLSYNQGAIDALELVRDRHIANNT